MGTSQWKFKAFLQTAYNDFQQNFLEIKPFSQTSMFRWRTCDDVIIYITNMLRRTFVPSILGNLVLVIITLKKKTFLVCTY